MAVDWRGIRQALRVRRAELHMGVNDVQHASGISRTTIYRIENVKDLPDHVMDLETVEALSTAMGLTLSAFFARIEGLKTVELASTDQPPRKAAAHARAVSAAERSADGVVERDFIAALAEEFVGAVDRLVESRTQNRTDTRA